MDRMGHEGSGESRTRILSVKSRLPGRLGLGPELTGWEWVRCCLSYAPVKRLRRNRRDSNPQPPERQSGALAVAPRVLVVCHIPADRDTTNE